MSRDLFAAFGSPDQTGDTDHRLQNHSDAATFSFFDNSTADRPGLSFSQVSTPILPQPGVPKEYGEDDWGDFEAAQEQKPTPVNTSRYHYALDELGSPKPDAKPTATVQPDTPNLLSYGQDSVGPFSRQPQTDVTTPKDPNVLFDAIEDFEDEAFGNFGDFEEAKAEQVKPFAPKLPEIDLLGLDDEVKIQPKVQPKVKPKMKPKVQGKQEARSKAPGMKLEKRIVPKQPVGSQPVKESNEAMEEEPWDDFSDWEQNATRSQPGSTVSETKGLTDKLAPLEGIDDPPNMAVDSLAPTNIPPPAIILSIFPEIFERVENELLKPVASQAQAVRIQVYSDPKTVSYLKGYLLILTVCARIIAGRKLRWKRDSILAQSMRIGSASAGRISGMKVTSVDKTEMTKEDGEVAEVLRIWSLQAGKIKSAVGEAKKLHSDELGAMPELRATIPVKAIKEIEGGVPSVRPCALCGLKREERVARVDFDVEDSFGEWWVEKTNMHRACRNFWVQHETSLRQR